MKPIYKFFIIALILGIIAWIIYFVISKTSERPQETISNNDVGVVTTNQTSSSTENIGDTATSTEIINTNSISDPESGTDIKTSFSKIEKISAVPVRFYWYYTENNRIFYITDSGEIKKVIDGKSETVQLNPLKDVSIVRSNRGGSRVLLKFTGDSGIVWGVFSSMDEKITPLSSSRSCR